VTATSIPPFGDALKRWRSRRHLSQLDLALDAGVSQRHISFLESGRATPSRQMVVRLARGLSVPLRERNALMLSAGHAPIYSERALDSAALGQVRHVLERIVAAHGSIPAYVVDRSWTVVLSNQAAQRLTGLFVDPGSMLVRDGVNVARLLLHPGALRDSIVNWDQVAGALLDRLALEVSSRPGDDHLRDLAAELQTYPGVAELSRLVNLPTADDLLVPIHIRAHELELRLFTTIATIGAAHDITLEELRIETLLPADATSEAALHRLSAS
jgi:transcriptional regulator with XRE-family HTH domain